MPDKLTLGFLCDVLYIKGIIGIEEYEAIQDAKSASDLENIVERMLANDFNIFKRGERKPSST